MTDHQPLLNAFLDDRDSLDEGQWAALADALARDPQLAGTLKEQLLLDEFLGQKLAVDRRDFPAQVRQRVRDFERGELELSRHVNEMRLLAAEEFSRRLRPQVWKRRLLMALAACLLLAVGAVLWRTNHFADLQAVIADVQGAGTLVRDGQATPVEREAEVRVGDRFVTFAEQSLSVRYADGTWVEIDADTSAEFRDDNRTHGKQVLIERGGMAAVIEPQPGDRPMRFTTPEAEAKIVGTEIWLARSGEQSQLEVLSGSVEFVRTSDGRSQLVRAGETSVVGADVFSVRAAGWPIDREGLVYLHQSAEASNLVRSPSRGGLRRCRLTPRGAARWQSDGSLQFAGGSAVARGGEHDVLTACRANRALTLEIAFTPSQRIEPGAGWIIGFGSDPANANFVLAQEQDKLLFALAGSQSNAGDPQPFVQIVSLRPEVSQHVVVTYRPGELIAYVDGGEVFRSQHVQSDFAHWEAHPLVLGDSLAGGQSWSGRVGAVAIYARALSAERVAAQTRAFRERTIDRPVNENP